MLMLQCSRNLLLKIRHLSHLRVSIKALSSQTSNLVSLTSRSIVQVNGKDSAKLLQGLFTNDINLLRGDNTSIYSMILNVSGRILYDVMVYGETDKEDSYLLECDRSISEELVKYLKRYKLRSKVYFNHTDLNVYALINCPYNDEIALQEQENCFKDPRLDQLGYRILHRDSEADVTAALRVNTTVENLSLSDYITFRYKLGISEGRNEVDNGIPLEHNVVSLNGVSFSKGCYVGQELVARAHHTGVIRKRIMPLTFQDSHNNLTIGDTIRTEAGKRVGKLIGLNGQVGIGLMRVKESLVDGASFCIQEKTVVPTKPDWWPDDLIC